MSRFSDYDNDDESAALDFGRWEHNSRVALKGRRGRKALAELREALLALPEPRLIESAVCTVDLDERLPSLPIDEGSAETIRYSRWASQEREEARARLATQGEGVCAMGAYVWYQKVKGGMDPAAAFAAVPTLQGVYDDGDGDPLHETANLGRDVGLTYTLAWNLAYRNDETYRRMTPEERWTAFMDWIDTELAESVAP